MIYAKQAKVEQRMSSVPKKSRVNLTLRYKSNSDNADN
jgi:hypothetical protein